MITSKDLEKVISQLKAALKGITESDSLTKYKFIDSIPDDSCQYWEYKLDFFDDYETSISQTCGYFIGEGQTLNPDIGINQFFKNNDSLMEEFEILNEQGVFQPILLGLKNAKELSGLEYVMISVEAYIRGGDEWLREICNELILILHEHESNNGSIDIGCQQNQRYQIKSFDKNKVTFFRVPFDKVNRFKDAERVEGYNKSPHFLYEVALSFAGEDRDYVEKLAGVLKKNNIRVFYDTYEQATLWGKDLYTHLDDVYRKNARFCILFLSQHYKDKVWTNHERESAQARAFEEKKEYILPVRLDDTEIPGIRPTTGYIDGRTVSPEELTTLLKSKLGVLE